MKTIILIILTVLSNLALATPTVKVALLDNLKSEKLATDRYLKGFLSGLEVAIDEAKRGGVTFELKEFLFGKKPLAILDTVKEVEAWKPDLVIGPRSSSLFLMIKGKLKDTLVLSPLATASDVAKMPANFYSLTLPNKYATKALVNLAIRNFKGKGIVPVIEVDCKYCVDLASQFIAVAKGKGIPIRIEKNYFLYDSVEKEDISKILKSYKPGDVFLMTNRSYTSGVMMRRISTHLKTPNLVFLGADGWGDWSSGYPGKFASGYPYEGLRVTPWSLDSKEKGLVSFKAKYKQRHGSDPDQNITYIAYTTLSSVIPVIKGIDNKEKNMRLKLLNAYKKKLSKEPNYSRPTDYAIYRVTHKGEEYLGSVPALDEGKKHVN